MVVQSAFNETLMTFRAMCSCLNVKNWAALMHAYIFCFDNKTTQLFRLTSAKETHKCAEHFLPLTMKFGLCRL